MFVCSHTRLREGGVHPNIHAPRVKRTITLTYGRWPFSSSSCHALAISLLMAPADLLVFGPRSNSPLLTLSQNSLENLHVRESVDEVVSARVDEVVSGRHWRGKHKVAFQGLHLELLLHRANTQRQERNEKVQWTRAWNCPNINEIGHEHEVATTSLKMDTSTRQPQRH